MGPSERSILETISQDEAAPLQSGPADEATLPRPAPMMGGESRAMAEVRQVLARRLSFLAHLTGAAFVVLVAVSDVPKLRSGRPVVVADGREYLAAHLVLIAQMLAIVAVFRARRGLTLRRLRWLEVAYLGSVCGHFAWMMWHEYHDPISGRLADLAGVTSSALSLPWFCLMVCYGTFIPNPGRRCAVIVALIALCPLAVSAAARLDPSLRTHVSLSMLAQMGIWMAVGASIITFGAYRVEELRQEATEARKLGHYQLKRLLGRGGMGEVYLGEHMLMRRPCAIKLIRPERAGAAENLRRFEREVQATATLSHWNTVQIFDYGLADDGTFYYVMEYLPGPTLDAMVRRLGPLPPGRAVHFLRQVCAALREAHAVGLIHRDIKPNNILACQRGRVSDVAKLLDFGLVRSVGPSDDGEDPAGQTAGPALGDAADPFASMTQMGTITGTPAYMSPEQAAGDRVDARSDLYSLGAVGYFLLVGRPPFVRTDLWDVIDAHRFDAVVPPVQLRDDVPSDLEAVILRCLEKDPGRRFADVEALDAALAACRCAGDWTEERAASWWHESGEAAWRRPEAAAETAPGGSIVPGRSTTVAGSTLMGSTESQPPRSRPAP